MVSNPQLKRSLLEIRTDLDKIISASIGSQAAHSSPGPEIQTIFFDIGDTLVQNSDWIPGAENAVTFLQQMQIPLGLISNTGNLSRDELSSLVPERFFDNFQNHLIVLSSEIGIEKPDLRIYFHAIGLAQRAASHCLFVGERLSETYAADRAGMAAIRLSDPIQDFAFLKSQFSQT